MSLLAWRSNLFLSKIRFFLNTDLSAYWITIYLTANSNHDITGFADLSYVKGDFDTAESYLQQALVFSEKTGHYTNWMTAGQHIFELYISMGEYKKAQKYYEKMVSIIEPTKYHLSEIGLYKVGLARSEISNPDHNVDTDGWINTKSNWQHFYKKSVSTILKQFKKV